MHFAQESFYLNDINEQDTSFLDCKHKHMLKCGAPPDKLGVHVPYGYLWNSMVSQAKLILRVITLWFLVLSQFFLGTVWVPLITYLPSQLNNGNIDHTFGTAVHIRSSYCIFL